MCLRGLPRRSRQRFFSVHNILLVILLACLVYSAFAARTMDSDLNGMFALISDVSRRWKRLESQVLSDTERSIILKEMHDRIYEKLQEDQGGGSHTQQRISLQYYLALLSASLKPTVHQLERDNLRETRSVVTGRPTSANNPSAKSEELSATVAKAPAKADAKQVRRVRFSLRPSPESEAAPEPPFVKLRGRNAVIRIPTLAPCRSSEAKTGSGVAESVLFSAGDAEKVASRAAPSQEPAQEALVSPPLIKRQRRSSASVAPLTALAEQAPPTPQAPPPPPVAPTPSTASPRVSQSFFRKRLPNQTDGCDAACSAPNFPSNGPHSARVLEEPLRRRVDSHAGAWETVRPYTGNVVRVCRSIHSSYSGSDSGSGRNRRSVPASSMRPAALSGTAIEVA